MVSLGGLAETRGVVRVAQPAGAEQAGLEALLEWLEREQDGLAEALAVHGALLLRGFAVDGAADFARVAQQAARLFPDPRPDATEAGPLRSYAGGDSPRTNVLQGVYTSTDAPASSDIALHNEMSFDPRWPSKVMFYCEQAPGSGGETPLADSRAVLAAACSCLSCSSLMLPASNRR